MSLSITPKDSARIAPLSTPTDVAPTSAPVAKARAAVSDTFSAAVAPTPLPMDGKPESAYDGKLLGAGG